MPHPVVHFEIGCQDKERVGNFYRRVFGWVIDPGPMGLIDTGSAAGTDPRHHPFAGPPTHAPQAASGTPVSEEPS